MVLEKYREGFGNFFLPIAHGFARLGFTPNGITILSLFFALAAGVAFALSSPEQPLLLILAAALVGANAILDALDGSLARVTNTASALGDYLDHVIDRYSDLAILVGISLSVWVDVRWGLLAIVGTFLTSYMGTQAQALGLGRNYRGLLGRADRLVLLIGAPVIEYASLQLGIPRVLGYTWLTLLLAYFAIVGNLTAIQRFLFGWRELKAREGAKQP